MRFVIRGGDPRIDRDRTKVCRECRVKATHAEAQSLPDVTVKLDGHVQDGFRLRTTFWCPNHGETLR